MFDLAINTSCGSTTKRTNPTHIQGDIAVRVEIAVPTTNKDSLKAHN